jgi:hypothetical protein
MKIRRVLALTGAAVLAVAAVAVPSYGAGQAEVRAELAQVRTATAVYHDVEQAIADGYEQVSPCVPNMGFHYQRGIAATAADLDPQSPEILVYAPLPNGELKLVAVEYASWDPDAALFGVAFDPPHAGGPPFHTLHAWVWQGNPAGMFVPTNRTVSCG